jgi:hypothetical protein
MMNVLYLTLSQCFYLCCENIDYNTWMKLNYRAVRVVCLSGGIHCHYVSNLLKQANGITTKSISPQ